MIHFNGSKSNVGGAEKEKARSNFVMLLSSRKSLPFRGRLV